MRELIYTKFSNERSRRYAVRTDIFEDDGRRSVRKTAVFPEGKEHIARIARLQDALNKEYLEAGFVCNKCSWEDDELWLEYVDADTLEERIDTLLEDRKTEEARELLLRFLRKIESIHSVNDFEMTDAFREIFGDIELPSGLKCAPVTNLDLICSNLLMTEVRTVLDYEWTVEFPVPGKYVLYRNLHYLGEFGVGRLELDMKDLCKSMGIDDALIRTFRKMEAAFQDSVVKGHTTMRSLYKEISPGVAEYHVEGADICQIYFNMGDGYTLENSVSAHVTGGKINMAVTIPKGCIDVRVDPCSSPCMVSVLRFSIDGTDVPIQNMPIPGGFLKGRRAYFTTDDPAFPGVLVPEGSKRLEIRMNFVKVNKKTAERLIQLEMENDRQLKIEDRRVLQLMMENEGLKAQIKEIKSTSVWKMYEMVTKKQ
ncbi:MAG: hypothetical protein IJ123_06865 [Blautia sp.]|nr:hypothetical protein [Blautia sp.]